MTTRTRKYLDKTNNQKINCEWQKNHNIQQYANKAALFNEHGAAHGNSVGSYAGYSCGGADTDLSRDWSALRENPALVSRDAWELLKTRR